ncbi:hypothetical protein PMAYCL1PPCAC_14864, partial [Pristionchus mayeri]
QVAWIVTVVCNAPPYLACFLYRHQVVLLPRSIFKLPFALKYGIVGVMYIYFGAHGALFWVGRLLRVTISLQFFLFTPSWPLSISSSVNCFNDNVVYAACVVLLTVSLCIIFLIAICTHIFSILSHHSSMSISVRKYNKMMTRMLLVQALVPCTFILCPICMVCVQVLVNFESYVSPLLAVDIAGLHSLMHSIVMISTSKTYRTVLTKMAFKLLGRPSTFSVSTLVNTHDAQTIFPVMPKPSVINS